MRKSTKKTKKKKLHSLGNCVNCFTPLVQKAHSEGVYIKCPKCNDVKWTYVKWTYLKGIDTFFEAKDA